MKILVTGGAGFIGSHIVEYNLAQGHTVHAVDDLSTGKQENLSFAENNPNFTFYQSDILTWSGLHEAVQWADVIYHMAAIIGVKLVLSNPIKMLENNIGCCTHLLKTISETQARPHVMIASSSMVYGDAGKSGVNEDDILNIVSTSQGHWGYGVSKLSNEVTAFAYYNAKKIPITIMRIFNMVGPRQSGRYGMVMPRFIEQACTNTPITVFGNGKQTRSFCDVRDLAKITHDLAKNPKSIGEIVNIGNTQEITIAQLAESIKNRSNSHSKIEYLSYKQAYGEDFIDIMNRGPDLKKLSTLISLQHQWSLEGTIDDLISRFKKNH